MLKQAIEKLKTEINSNASTPYVQIVGQFLLKHIEAHPEQAEKILTADKTIAKSLDSMRNEASKKKVGNCAVLTDQEGFSIVLKYFGIDSPYQPCTEHSDCVVTDKKGYVEHSLGLSEKFDIDLEDLF